MSDEPEFTERPAEPADLFCPACGSTQYLVHRNGCTSWQLPIEWPQPLEPQPALEATPPLEYPPSYLAACKALGVEPAPLPLGPDPRHPCT